MYTTIKDYFDLRIAEFNSANGDYLIEVNTKLTTPPAGQRQRNYNITLTNFEEGQIQSERYTAEGEISLTFNIINKNVDTYETIQEYVYKLARYIRRKHQYSANSKKWIVREISGSDLDNIQNDKLVCKLVFTGEFYETNAVTISAPSTPTLSTPANGGEGTVDQSFDWGSVSGATSYTFELSNTGGVVFTQSGLTVSSYTIPQDSLLTVGSVYQWRVKAIGEGGSSAWSGYYSFTVASSAFEYEQETDALEARHTVAPDATRKGHMNTLIKGLKDANIWDRLDVLQMYQSHSITSNDWGLNWRKNAHNATGQGSVGLTIDSPVTTNGSSTHIKTGFTPSTDGIAYSVNRASIGVKMLNESSSSGSDVGWASVSGTGYVRLQFRSGSNTYALRLNTIAGAVLSGSNSISKAFHIVTRSSPTAVSYYKDGTLVQAGTGQDAGTVGGSEILVGNDDSNNRRAGSYGTFFAGTYLSATDITNIVTLVNAYYTNIGAQV